MTLLELLPGLAGKKWKHFAEWLIGDVSQ